MAKDKKQRERISFDEAIKIVQSSQNKNWDLVDECVLLVNKYMWYSRSNGYQHYKRAFSDKGKGFCQQHSYFLKYLLKQVNIQSYPVFSLWNEYPTLKHAPHIWLQVQIGDERRDYCSVFCNKETAEPTFYTKSKVFRFYNWMRIPVGFFGTIYNWIYFLIARKN